MVIDIWPSSMDFRGVKRSKSRSNEKSKGTSIVQEHRPLMNKLTDAERQQLLKAGYELIYGNSEQPQPANRRR